MNYYNVEFAIVKLGTFRLFNMDGGGQDDGGFMVAQGRLGEDLCAAGICTVHAYGWCDGSTYKYVRSGLESDKLRAKMNAVLEKIDSPFRVKDVSYISLNSEEPWEIDIARQVIKRFQYHDWEENLPPETKALSGAKKFKLFNQQKEQNESLHKGRGI